MIRACFLSGILACLAACAPPAPAAPAVRAAIPFSRCINLGNALEAPREGDWGYTIRPADLDRIKAAGFDGVRVPVRWDVHTGAGPDFTVDPAFFARIDAVVDGALTRGLSVVLDIHHFEPMWDAPARETPRFAALWRQIAARYADLPESLVFEVLNEPHGDVMPARVVEQLNALALREIRGADPDRLVIVGPPQWNNISGLDGWTPPDDPHVAVTVHFYEPHDFTHSGASWLKDPPHYDRRWGRSDDITTIRNKAARVAAFGRDHHVAMLLGEFGVNTAVPLNERALWTRTVRKAFASEGAAWCAWDYAGAFKAYDQKTEGWIAPMKRALLDQ